MKIVIGTRKSQIPLIQSRSVAQLLSQAGADVEIRPIETVGDTLDVALEDRGGSSVFVREIDESLIKGEIDVAIHDMKDVAVTLPEGVAIAAVPERVDPREAFVSTQSRKLSSLAKGSRIGVSGPCRAVQLARLRPDAEIVFLSGDVEARLRALSAGEIDAIVMSAAGPLRIGVPKVIAEYLPVEKIVPRAGQGALAVEVRSEARELVAFVKKACHHRASGVTVLAERAFVRALSAMHGAIIAANADIKPSGLLLTGLIASEDWTMFAVERESGPLEAASSAGTKLAEKMVSHLQKKAQ